MKGGSSSRTSHLAIASSSSSSSPSAEQLVFQSGLINLLSAIRCSNDVNYNKIMINIQFLVFALCWFGMVCPIRHLHVSMTLTMLQGEVDFPKDDATFFDVIVS
jgi:hypothetical protein